MMHRLAAGFVYSNVFVGLVLASLTSCSYFIFSAIEFRWYLPLTIFSGSVMLYSFHRLYKIDFIPEDQLENRHKWILAREKWMKSVMFIGLFLVMILLPNYNAETIISLIPAGIISAGYTIPIIPSDQGWRRFRDIPLAKPLIISVVVSYFTLGFPVIDQLGFESILNMSFLTAFIERTLFLLAVTVPFDIRDLVNDRDAGLKTLATRFGLEVAKKSGYVFLSAWAIICLFQAWEAGFAVAYLMIPATLFLLVLIAYQKLKVEWHDLAYVYVFEGLIILYAMLWSLKGNLHWVL